MRGHKDLNAWKMSMEFVTDVYRVTKEFPKEELYGLTNQIRRAAVSVPSNIAEGAGRDSRKEFVHFLYVALGSLAEVETQLMISRNLDLLDDFDAISGRVETIRKLINGLIFSLKRNTSAI